jgi:hypothetical protein
VRGIVAGRRWDGEEIGRGRLLGLLRCRRARGVVTVALAASWQRVVVAVVVEFGLSVRVSWEIGLVVWALAGGGICGWL